MKLTMLALGSRGDVQPYVSLGMGLKRAGYDVLLATHSNFEEFVTSHGLRFHSLGGDIRAMTETEEGRAMSAGRDNPTTFVRNFKKLFETGSDDFLTSSLQACEGAGAIIYSVFAFSGYHIAEKMGIPSLPAFLQPFSRTTAFPLQPPPADWMRTRVYNYTTYIGAQQMFGQAFKAIMDGWRTERLGLPPLPRGGLYSLIDTQHLPVLYGYSPVTVRKPSNWGPHIHVTGYWFLDRPADWSPPARLAHFIKAGTPPVYVGFGSITGEDPKRTTEVVVSAIQKAGQRGILLGGWGGLRNSDLPDDVYHVESVPHDWLFPHMGAVVHHGGAGTTGAALRSGVPSFATPIFADQFFWGDRIARLGVGPKPIPQHKLTVDNLAKAISTAVSDEEMKRRAAVVGKRIQAEDGVARAVEAFRKEVEL